MGRKKNRKIEPKVKHKMVLKNLATGMSKKDALLKAGFSMSTARQPKRVLESKGFQKLLKRRIGDEGLIKTLKEGLKATTTKVVVVGKYKDGTPITKRIHQKDFSVRHKYLKTGLELKGHIKEDPGNNSIINIAVILDKLEDESNNRIIENN